MPLDPITGSLIETGANALASIFTQKSNFNNSVKMFNMQHQTALDDWNRQNDYNSPAAQMGRNKDAGLNPNLIYGNMTNSAPIKTGDSTTPQMQAPRSQGLSNAILMKQQLAQSNAQTQLLAQQANAAAEDAALKRAQTANITADTTLKGATTDNTQFTTSQNRLMSPGSLEQQQVTNAKLRADINRVQAETGSILNATDISRIMLEPNKARVIQEILNLKASTAKSYAEQKLIKSTIESNDVQNALRRIETEERQVNLGQNKFNFGEYKKGRGTQHDSYPWRKADQLIKSLNINHLGNLLKRLPNNPQKTD